MEEEAFTAQYGLGQPENRLVRKGILDVIQESRNRDSSVYGLSWVTRTGMCFVLKALKRADMIHVRVIICTGAMRSRRWHCG